MTNKTRILECRFVDQIKNEGIEKTFENPHLVVQAYNDAGKNSTLTQAPTVQHASQRVILIVSLVFNLSIYTRDISQVYTQSSSQLARDIYIKAPSEMNLPKDAVLQVILPIYGVPESGTRWFKTYHTHYTKKLGMCKIFWILWKFCCRSAARTCNLLLFVSITVGNN